MVTHPMFSNRRHQPPTPPSQLVVIVRIPGMEHLVSAIADLTAVVNSLVAVEQQVVDALHNQPPTGTVLTADDQSALDAAVATVQSVTETLAAALPAAAATPSPEPAPAELAATEPPASPNP